VALTGFAVERRLFPANPLDQIQWNASEVAETVDRRSVANPPRPQASCTPSGDKARGEHMEAFFGCLYYAALRPAEAVALREADCVLPACGRGRIDLAASEPRDGTRWTDDGASREERGLKHRAPARPAASPSARPPGPDAPRPHCPLQHRTRRTAVPHQARRPLNDTGYGEVWQRARPATLTAAQQASPLARRPYDLRHAALWLWLNAGVPATEVARRAGHGVAVLLTVYANGIDGQAGRAATLIIAALASGKASKPRNTTPAADAALGQKKPAIRWRISPAREP
jgi:integrase